MYKRQVPAFGPLPLDGVTVAAVRAWFASYGARTPTARAHAYQVLSTIMKQAEDDELIVRTPCRIRAGGRTKAAHEPEVLTRAELFALADAMPRQHRALTLVCGMCTLRFGEAVALRRRDVDLEARTATADGVSHDFQIDDYTRWRLLEGLDDIALTLRDEEAIAAFEAKRPAWMPTTQPVQHGAH